MSLILHWTLCRQQTEGTDGLLQQSSDYNHDHHWGHPQVILCVWMFSSVLLFKTPWTVACLAPLSLGFPRQKYWSGLPFPPPVDLPNSGIVPVSPASPALQEDSLPPEPLGKPKRPTAPGMPVVSHASTNQAQLCLASKIRWDQGLSG